MKKLLIKLSVAIITLFIGLLCVSCYNFWFYLPEIKVAEENTVFACPFRENKVSVCQLMDFPDKYDDDWIVTEATIYFAANGEYVVYPKNCIQYNFDIFVLEPSLKLKGYKGLNSNLKSILKKNMPFWKEVDVRIEGISKSIFDKSRFKQYLIIPHNIEIISPFRKFEPKAAA